MIRRATEVLLPKGGKWGSHWVRSHAERRRQDGEAWAAVEVGNGLADRWADNPTGQLRKSCDNNPITPVRWWTAIPANTMEELEDTNSRNVLSMSTESDTRQNRRTLSATGGVYQVGLADLQGMEGAANPP